MFAVRLGRRSAEAQLLWNRFAAVTFNHLPSVSRVADFAQKGRQKCCVVGRELFNCLIFKAGSSREKKKDTETVGHAEECLPWNNRHCIGHMTREDHV
jgi:hypothetical protein